jgi:sigma-E factor negative regulatory protein RseA
MKDSTMPPPQSMPRLFEDASFSETKPREWALSALMDSETDAPAWDALWDGDEGCDSVHATWHRYHLIGDVLRAGQSPVGSVNALEAASAMDFARRVTQIARDQGMLTQASPSTAPSHTVESTARVAANDGVFRWKMVAGLASFTAVLGIAWGVVGVAGQSDGAVLAAASDKAPVLVSTPQGQVLRDARLQELMQTHRQSGGVSALQAPAGFLRTSALDAGQR